MSNMFMNDYVSDQSIQSKEDLYSSIDMSMSNMLMDDSEEDDMPGKLHSYITGENIQPPSSSQEE